MVHTKIYVIECESPDHWYVGSTYRELYDRVKEHEDDYGSLWTQRHGFRRVAMWRDVPCESCSVLEDELTEWLMHQYGVRNVRGGNYVNCRTDCYANDWWLPRSLRSGFRNVTGLHYRPVSKFPLELERLIDGFKVFRRLQHSNHLDAEALPDPVLGGVAQHEHHVLPAELVAPALGAEQVAVVGIGPDHGQELVESVADGLGEPNIDSAP